MKKLELAEHKAEYLRSLGFEQTYKSDKPREYQGTLSNMEEWSKFTLYNSYHLYIHFDEVDSNFCNLYTGNENDRPEVFSERNLISEMRKRGFEVE